MNEVYGYDAQAFPYSEIFEELTVRANGPDRGLEFTDMYIALHGLRREAGLPLGYDYGSSSITSGGHAHNSDLTIPDVITSNTRTGRLMATELAWCDVIDPQRFILPVDLGKVPDWKQSQYMGLWLMVESGINLGTTQAGRNAGRYKELLTEAYNYPDTAVDLDRMDDSGLSAAERAEEYFRFSKATHAATQAYKRDFPDLEPHPAHRVLNLVDTRVSLGCSAERAFAKLQGIRTYDIVAAGPDADPLLAARQPELREDIDSIVTYGGSGIELQTGNVFTLAEDRKPAFA